MSEATSYRDAGVSEHLNTFQEPRHIYRLYISICANTTGIGDNLLLIVIQCSNKYALVIDYS